MGREGKGRKSFRRTQCRESDRVQVKERPPKHQSLSSAPSLSAGTVPGKGPGAQSPGATNSATPQPALGRSGLPRTRARPQRGIPPRSVPYLAEGSQTWCGKTLAQGQYNPQGQTMDEATLEPPWREKVNSSGQCTIISQWSTLSPDGFNLNPCKMP